VGASRYLTRRVVVVYIIHHTTPHHTTKMPKKRPRSATVSQGRGGYKRGHRRTQSQLTVKYGATVMRGRARGRGSRSAGYTRKRATFRWGNFILFLV
jgi:hypothetical protein